jgi:hypothetical protein
MATGTVPSTVLPPPPPATDEQREHERIIHRQLDRTRLYVRLVDLTGSLIGLAIGVIGFLLVVALIDHWVVGLGFAGRTVAALLLVGAVLWYLVVQVVPLLIKSINPTYAARTIEEATPTLKNSLVNFLLLRQDRSHVREVVYQAVEAKAAADIANVPVEATIDRSRLIRAGYVLCGVMAILAAYKILSPKDPFQTAARVVLPWAEIARPSRVTIVDVKPGDSEVYFGDVALVSAEVRGVREGDPVTLLMSTADGQTVDQPISMTALPGGLRFECQVPPPDAAPRSGLAGMQQDVTYRIVAGDAETSAYKLSVVTAPTIVVERLEYQYPAYTKKEPLTVSGQGDIQALEGTKVVVHATANQPIKSAWIEFDPHVTGRPPEMIRLATEGTRAWGAVVLELKEDRQTPWHETYQVRFYNERGHQNDEPSLHRLEVIRDLPPEVQILAPAKPRIEVPEDGAVPMEVRGVDPDFGLSKLQLRGAAGEKRVEIDLIPPDAGQPPQLTVPYLFRPRDHHLVAGDELTYMAQAEDNRVNATTGQPEPNVARSREYVLVVIGPESPRDPNQTPPQPGQNPDQDQNPNNLDPNNRAQQPPNQQPGEPQTPPDRGGQQPPPGTNRPQDPQNQPPPQGGNPPPMPGQSPMPGQPQPQDGNPMGGQPPNAQPMNSQPMDGQPMNAPPMGAEPMTGEPMAGGQQGEGNPAGGNPGGSGQQPPGQGDPMAGGQSGGQSGNQAAGGQAGQNSAGQSQPGQSQPGQNQPGQNQPGAGQPGQTNQIQPRQGESSSQPNADGQQGGQPGNSGAAGNQPQTGQNASSGNSAGGQNPDNAPGTQNAEGSGHPTGEETGDGASGAGPQGKAHDGQAIDQILKKYQELQEKLREAQSGGKNGEQGQPQGESAQQPRGEQPAGEQGTAGEGVQPEANGDRGSENPQPMGQQPGTGASPQESSQDGGNSATSRVPGQPGQPGQPAGGQGEKQPGEAEADPTGEKPAGTEQNIEQGAGKLPDENQGTEQPEKSAGGGLGGKPMGPNKTGREQPMTDETQPKGSTAERRGGAGQNGEAGAGDKSEDKSGSGPGQEQNRDRPKEQQGGNDASQQNDPSGVSNSKKQSDSSGGESGDRSGGGKKGPGQSGGQAGNDSAGSNSAGDQGAGKANERGSGETGERAGSDQQSSGKTGQGGNRPGQGSQTKANPMGDKTGKSEPGPQDATGGQPGERSTDQRPGDPSERRGQQPGGSTPAGGGGGDSSPPESPGGEAAAADAANLEYARKATELALQKLKELDQNPDPELLDRLGWTKEDLAEFLNRWNSLQQSAQETVDGQRELDEALRSLGLRDPALRSRAGGTTSDDQRGLRDSGGRTAPPPKYRELFESFRKGASRSP